MRNCQDMLRQIKKKEVQQRGRLDMEKEMINREDHAREVARLTGFSIGDVKEIFRVADLVELACLEKGITVKQGKLYIKEVVEKPARKRYDGFKKEYYMAEPRKAIVIRPLSAVTKLEDKLNKE